MVWRPTNNNSTMPAVIPNGGSVAAERVVQGGKSEEELRNKDEKNGDRKQLPMENELSTLLHGALLTRLMTFGC